MSMSLQFREHNRDLGMIVREVDEDLATFLGIRNDQQNHRNQDQDYGISLQSEMANGRQESAPSMGQKLTPRAATPNRVAAQRSASTTIHNQPLASVPTSKATLHPSCASAPTSRATLPSSRPVGSRATSATPTRKPASVPCTISDSFVSDKPSSRRKTGTKNPNPSSRGALRMLNSVVIDQNLTPKRPASVSRGRPSGPATHHTLSLKGNPRLKSCSPAKVGSCRNGSGMMSRSRGCGDPDSQDVNPVLIGMKMVERVVNTRKLAPPRQDQECHSVNTTGKSSAGFGRSLSSTSLEMALRHMDISQRLANELYPESTGVRLKYCGEKSSEVRIDLSSSTMTSDSSKSTSSSSSSSQ